MFCSDPTAVALLQLGHCSAGLLQHILLTRNFNSHSTCSCAPLHAPLIDTVKQKGSTAMVYTLLHTSYALTRARSTDSTNICCWLQDSVCSLMLSNISVIALSSLCRAWLLSISCGPSTRLTYSRKGAQQTELTQHCTEGLKQMDLIQLSCR